MITMKWVKVSDILFTVLFCALGIILWICFTFAPAGNTVQILKDGELYYEASLNEEAEIVVKDRFLNVIRIDDGKVCVFSSTCPTQDCVHTGYISESGYSIVCAPNKVCITITGEKGADIDGLTY